MSKEIKELKIGQVVSWLNRGCMIEVSLQYPAFRAIALPTDEVLIILYYKEVEGPNNAQVYDSEGVFKYSLPLPFEDIKIYSFADAELENDEVRLVLETRGEEFHSDIQIMYDPVLKRYHSRSVFR